jgi:hypothetical protein
VERKKKRMGALSLTIIPNPAKNKVKVGFENNNYKELNLQIFNINGEEVFNRQLHSYPQDNRNRHQQSGKRGLFGVCKKRRFYSRPVEIGGGVGLF